jgi:TatD DNase family protein
VPLTIIDTHAHVYADAFDTDRPLMLQRAKEAGISKILMPGIDSSTHRPMLAVEDNNPDFCISMMGLHPC